MLCESHTYDPDTGTHAKCIQPAVVIKFHTDLPRHYPFFFCMAHFAQVTSLHDKGYWLFPIDPDLPHNADYWRPRITTRVMRAVTLRLADKLATVEPDNRDLPWG